MAATAVVQPLALECIWFDKWRYDQAECHYQQTLAGTALSVKTTCQGFSGKSELVNQIAKAREQIQNTLNSDMSCQMSARVAQVEEVNRKLEAQVASLTKELSDLRLEMYSLVGKKAPESSTPAAAPKAAAPAKADEDDDDFELFGSDDEDDDAAEKLKAQRIAAYQEKKSAKPTVIAKSNIILDIKPWDDETDMKALENEVRAITMEGLVWGASKLVPIAYGVKKLSISCVVVDDLVSTDDLEEKIVAIEDYVQSMDIAAFNKV